MRHDWIFIDTSMFKALIDEEDDFHEIAENFWKEAYNHNLKFLTNNFILDESYTLIRTRCGLEKVFRLQNEFLLEKEKIFIERVSVNDESEAWNWFEKDWKGLSFTDCVSFVMMKRLGITTVATFNRHFQKAGFQCIP